MRKLIIPLSILILVWIACSNKNKDVSKREDGTVELQKDEKIYSEKTSYEKGMDLFEADSYRNALSKFEEVEKSDSNYADAQEKIKICKQELAAIDEKNKERDKIENKYKRMFEKTGQYLHEKQNKLLRNGFREYQSGYEEAPDGSDQIAMYYSKEEDGYTVHVRLQYSYAMDSHYARVWIE